MPTEPKQPTATAGTPRYTATYRRDEITLICQAAREGDSVCLVGIAGTGKSNITNFLHVDPYAYKVNYLDRETGSIHFPVVDGNTWDGTPEGLWTQMATALAETTAHLQSPTPDPKIAFISADQRAFSELKQRLKALCQQQAQKVMFILDDFDDVIRRGPLDLLEQLNALRSDGNRDQLSYLLFTKRLPHILGQAHPLRGKSKFYDLFSQHIYALGPYTPEDEHQMLLHLNEGAGKPLRQQELATIKSLAGGHARLLKILFDSWRAEPPTSQEYLKYFLQKSDINEECNRIFIGLHPDEQDVLQRLVNGNITVDDDAFIDHLIRRGMLHKNELISWFSPLFRAYVESLPV